MKNQLTAKHYFTLGAILLLLLTYLSTMAQNQTKEKGEISIHIQENGSAIITTLDTIDTLEQVIWLNSIVGIGSYSKELEEFLRKNLDRPCLCWKIFEGEGREFIGTYVQVYESFARVNDLQRLNQSAKRNRWREGVVGSFDAIIVDAKGYSKIFNPQRLAQEQGYAFVKTIPIEDPAPAALLPLAPR